MTPMPATGPGRFRVLVLIGHSLEDPLPEAVEMAKTAKSSDRWR
jgi:hypothetical protein